MPTHIHPRSLYLSNRLAVILLDSDRLDAFLADIDELTDGLNEQEKELLIDGNFVEICQHLKMLNRIKPSPDEQPGGRRR